MIVTDLGAVPCGALSPIPCGATSPKIESTKFNLNSRGPVSQRQFLIELGILYRAKTLIKNANSTQRKKIKKGLDFLINKEKMGKIFNVISISNKKVNNLIGF